MPATLTKRETKNTYHLPSGEQLRRELVKFFTDQRKAILRYARTGKIEKKDQEAGLIPGWPSWDQFELGVLAMTERMTPIITTTWDAAGSAFTTKVGLDPDAWSVVNPETAKAIKDSVLDFAQSTNDTTSMELVDALDEVRKTLHEGIVDQGESLRQLTKRINAIFDKATTGRARRIAQTETTRAVHAAQEAVAIQSGVVTGWKWLASSDACEICLAIAARCPFVRLGQPFAVIGDNPTYQTIKFPPAHPFCRCSMTQVLDTDPQPDFKPTLDQPEGITDEEAEKLQAENERTYNDILAGSVDYGGPGRVFVQPGTPATPGRPKVPPTPKQPAAKRPKREKLPPVPYEPAELPGQPLGPGAEIIPRRPFVPGRDIWPEPKPIDPGALPWRMVKPPRLPDDPSDKQKHHDVVMEAAEKVPAKKLWGRDAAFIHHVFDEYKKMPGVPKMSLGEFKKQLVANELLRARTHRADLVREMNPDDVKAAETEIIIGGQVVATIHFIRVTPKGEWGFAIE